MKDNIPPPFSLGDFGAGAGAGFGAGAGTGFFAAGDGGRGFLSEPEIVRGFFGVDGIGVDGVGELLPKFVTPPASNFPVPAAEIVIAPPAGPFTLVFS